jgi:LysR family transcriptional regulator for bpeEF and oprC
MDKLRAMQIFSRVVEARSFAGAANILAVPRSTISRAIQELEASLGVRLLQRTTRTLHVTPNGSLYYDHCQRILGAIEGVEATLSDSTVAPRGLLRVDMTSSFARAVVLPVLHEFQTRHPAIDLTLTLGDRPVELVQEGVDCVVRAGTPDSLDALDGHDIVGYQSAATGRATDWRFTVDGAEHTIAAGTRLIVNDTDAYLGCGLEGLGLIRVASYVALPHLKAGRLVRVLPAVQGPPVPLSLIYPQDRHLASTVRAFADWLGQQVHAQQSTWHIPLPSR